MGNEIILAVVACCGMIAAVLMAAFAYRLNEKWNERNEQLADICEEQNELIKRMNNDWLRFYDCLAKNGMVKISEEEKKNERD